MYETPLFMNIAKTKTIVKISLNEVDIKTHGRENFNVTFIL